MTDGRTEKKPIKVLLLDDRQDNLILRSAILRGHGYEAVSSASVEEAETHLGEIDIAVLDYHLGAGKFGTEVAQSLRDKRPEVPIIILSATLERKFGGVEDMHLLKGSSSVDDLLAALRSFEAKRRGKPVVVDARDFFYSRIAMAMGDDIVLEILDRDGVWQYVNDFFARMYEKKRAWFAGKNRFEEFPELSAEAKKLQASADEITDRVRRQAERVDGLTTEALNTVEQVGQVVNQAVSMPPTCSMACGTGSVSAPRSAKPWLGGASMMAGSSGSCSR
jgi:response regulator RpfG family c-di-GMP phosphodiesterase